MLSLYCTIFGGLPIWSLFVVLLHHFQPILAEGQTSEDRIFIKTEKLPTPFAQSSLPSYGTDITRSVGPEKCYNLIGCFEKLPISGYAKDPLDFNTEFRIYDRSGSEEVIRIGDYENCLFSRPTDCNRYLFNLQQIQKAKFDLSRRTIIVIAGYFSKNPSTWELRIKDIWLELSDVNVIVVSWVGGNKGLYAMAAINTRAVARQITVLLHYLAELGGTSLKDQSFAERLYVIGHSLGAHIAGFVGQDLNGRLGRITGLDPAGPNFDKLPINFRLDKSDAQLVDIMHTNAGSKLLSLKNEYGSSLASGHLDYFVNDGRHQPGCSGDLFGCSHKRAVRYYEACLHHEASIRSGLKCQDCSAFRLRAYASDTFQGFRDGSAMVQRCPITTGNNSYSDLDKCSVPIDYFSSFGDFKEQLELKHGIDFNIATSGPENSNKYYFYTTMDQLSDNYLLKIRLANNKTTIEKEIEKVGRDSAKDSLVCNFKFEIEMENRLIFSDEIHGYIPIDLGNQYGIVLPVISPDFNSKYELSKLLSNNYYLGNKEDKGKLDSNLDKTTENKIRESLEKILPLWIRMTSLSCGVSGQFQKRESEENFDRDHKSDSVMGYFKKLLSKSIRSESKPIQPEVAGLELCCGLKIESLSLQPMRDTLRHLEAFYSVANKENPEVIIVGQDNDEVKINLQLPRAPLVSPFSSVTTNKPDCRPHGMLTHNASSLNIDVAVLEPSD